MVRGILTEGRRCMQCLLGVVLLFGGTTGWSLDAHFQGSVSPVQSSLGGAGAAGNPQDFLGSVGRNPATATLFQERMLSLNLGAHIVDGETTSALGAARGSSDNAKTFLPFSSAGVLLRPAKTNVWALYMALLPDAGLGSEYHESNNNPIFRHQSNGGFGKGKTKYEVARIDCGTAFRLSDKWSFGVAISPAFARLRITPFTVNPGNDANGDGTKTYPQGDDTDIAAGFGAKLGFRYKATEKWALGLSVTSPTWFEDFRYKLKDEVGSRGNYSYNVDSPPTVQFGLSFDATPRCSLYADATWIGYHMADGLGERGLATDGHQKGYGFQSIWVFGGGVQYDVNQKLTLRAGYNYNQNTVRDEDTFYAVLGAVHQQHEVALGASWQVNKRLRLDTSWTHTFTSEQDSPWYSASGPVADSWVKSSLGVDTVHFGLNWTF